MVVCLWWRVCVCGCVVGGLRVTRFGLLPKRPPGASYYYGHRPSPYTVPRGRETVSSDLLIVSGEGRARLPDPSVHSAEAVRKERLRRVCSALGASLACVMAYTIILVAGLTVSTVGVAGLAQCAASAAASICLFKVAASGCWVAFCSWLVFSRPWSCTQGFYGPQLPDALVGSAGDLYISAVLLAALLGILLAVRSLYCDRITFVPGYYECGALVKGDGCDGRGT